MPAHILVVDDDPDLRRLIVDFLAQHGFNVSSAENAAQLRLAMRDQRPDLIVLDVMMPGEDGLTAVRQLTSERPAAPVIMLSALGSDTDRIIGLEVGADDYLSKPCNPRELLARIRALLRRAQATTERQSSATQPVYEFGGWRLDALHRDLRDPDGVYVSLSDGEFTLLRSFVEHPQRVLSRDLLLVQARGQDCDVYDRAIDSQISRLRRKLNERGYPELIRTIRNEGYLLLPPVRRL